MNATTSSAPKCRVLLICGSLRSGSTNAAVLDTARSLSFDRAVLTRYDGLAINVDLVEAACAQIPVRRDAVGADGVISDPAIQTAIAVAVNALVDRIPDPAALLQRAR